MALVWNYEFRKHFRQLKREENGERGSDGVSARFDILFLLTLHADEQGRCWPKVRTLADEAGCSEPTATAAMEWLREREAFCNVPHHYRLPSEKKLPISKHVYQLTGFIRLDGERVYYLYCNPDTLSHMAKNFEVYTADSSAVEETDSSANESSANESSAVEDKVFPALEVVPEEEVCPTTEPFRAGEAGAATASPRKAFSFDRNADAPIAPPDTGSPDRREEELLDQRTLFEKEICEMVGRKSVSKQVFEIGSTHSSEQGGPPDPNLPSPIQACEEDPLYLRWIREDRKPFFLKKRSEDPKAWGGVHIARYMRATYGLYLDWKEKHPEHLAAAAPAAPPKMPKLDDRTRFPWMYDEEGRLKEEFADQEGDKTE